MATLKNTVINDVGAITLPKGTSAQRPTNPPNGSMRYNTDLGYTEAYYNGFWFDLSTGRGLPTKTENKYILLDASLSSSTNGTTAAGWTNIGYQSSRNFEFFGSPTYTSNGLNSYWRFDGNQMAVCENQCNDLQYNTVECVFRRFANSPEDILYNKENTWEAKTDSSTFQWAWQTTDRSWFWSSTGAITDNQWYHSVVTYDGNRVRAYINGRLRQEDTGNYENGTLIQTHASYPKINSRGIDRTQYSNTGHHEVAYFAVYDTPLSDQEQHHNYQCMAERFNIPYIPYNQEQIKWLYLKVQ